MELLKLVLLGVLECYGILFGGALIMAFIDYLFEKIKAKFKRRKEN